MDCLTCPHRKMSEFFRKTRNRNHYCTLADDRRILVRLWRSKSESWCPINNKVGEKLEQPS